MSQLEDLLQRAFTDGDEPGSAYNPYMDLELADLVKIAQQADVELDGQFTKTAAAETGFDLNVLDDLGGRVMAHAMFHEFGQIQEKVASGLCRVCKENALNVQGGSICDACLGGEE